MRLDVRWIAPWVLGCLSATNVLAGNAPPLPPDPATARPRPLALEQALARQQLELKGWVDLAVTTSPLTDAEEREARLLSAQAEGFVFHQGWLSLERTLREGRGWDVGAKVAMVLGEDATLMHARGLLDDQTGSVQVDLYEAWVSLRFPLAAGLTLQLGKLATPLGYEYTEAARNALPSRSTIFGYGLPFTHVGGLATLALDPRWTLAYGLVLGWDVWDDANDALTHLGTASFTPASGRDVFAVGGSLGAEREDDDDDLRIIVDGTWTHRWSPCVEGALNGHVGWEEGAAAGQDARWYGVAAYLTWKAGARVALPARAELFRDEDGTRVGVPATLLGLTLGVDWTLWDAATTLRLRPEVRYDRSLDGAFYDGGADEDQLSLTLDAILLF